MASDRGADVQQLEERLRSNPNSLVFSRIADSYRKGGDIPRAVEICSKGLGIYPTYITGRIILGRCYLEQQNFNEAVKEFTRVCRQDRRNHIAIKMLADVFSKQGMEEKAGDLYSLLLTMDPENASLMHLTSVFKGTGRTDLGDILGFEAAPASVAAMEEQGTAEAAGVTEGVVREQADGVPDESSELASGEVTDDAALADLIEAGESAAEADAVAVPELGEAPAASARDILADMSESTVEVEAQGAGSPEVADDAGLTELTIAEDAPEATVRTPKETDRKEAPANEEPSGDDIGSRMDEMFGRDEEASVAGTVTQEVPEATAPTAQETPAKGAATEATSQADQDEAPAGEDIASRMQDMFGTEEGTAVSSTEEPAVEGIPLDEVAEEAGTAVSGEEMTVEVETEDLLEEAPAAAEPSVMEDLSAEGAQQGEVGEEVTGEIEDQDLTGTGLDEVAVAGEPEAAGPEGAESLETPETAPDIDMDTAEDPLSQAIESAETVVIDRSQLATAGVQSFGETDTPESAVADSAAPETADTDDSVLAEAGAVTGPPTQEDGSVSGDDVASRLDDMFATDDATLEASDEAVLADEAGVDFDMSDMDVDPAEEVAVEKPTDAETMDMGVDAQEALDGVPAVGAMQDETEPFGRPSREADDEMLNVAEATQEIPLDAIRAAAGADRELPELSVETEDIDDGVSGADVVSRLEDMFPDEPDGAAPADGIPDDDIEEGEPAGEFYTESGDTASQGGDGVASTEEQIAEADGLVDAESRESEQADDAGVVMGEEPELGNTAELGESPFDDEATPPRSGVISGEAEDLVTDAALIPEDDIDDSSPVGQFYGESGDAAQEETGSNGPEAAVDEETISDEITIEAVADVDLVLDEALVPEDEGEEETAVGEFYTESGDMASEFYDESGGAALETEAEEEMPDAEALETDQKPSAELLAATDSVLEEPLDTMDVVPEEETAEEEVSDFYSVSGDSAPVETLEPEGQDERTDETSASEEQELDARPIVKPPTTEDARHPAPVEESPAVAESIPDHVLTPTLADIYYQQNQPDLAAQIYERLLERDPDNDKLSARVKEIRQAIRERGEPEQRDGRSGTGPMTTVSNAGSTKKTSSGRSSRKRTRKVDDDHPLKGVRISKQMKERIQRQREELGE